MKYIANIFNAIIRSAQNWKIWLRVLILVITGFAGVIMFSRTKVKKEDCTYYIEQNKQLVNALIEIKSDLQSTVTTSYNELPQELIVFASFDTVPNPKKTVRSVISKIDSLLLKYQRQRDSVKIKSKT